MLAGPVAVVRSPWLNQIGQGTQVESLLASWYGGLHVIDLPEEGARSNDHDFSCLLASDGVPSRRLSRCRLRAARASPPPPQPAVEMKTAATRTTGDRGGRSREAATSSSTGTRAGAARAQSPASRTPSPPKKVAAPGAVRPRAGGAAAPRVQRGGGARLVWGGGVTLNTSPKTKAGSPSDRHAHVRRAELESVGLSERALGCCA